MRIGIVTGEYPPRQGGVGAFSRILAQTLAAQGQTVFVLAGSDAEATKRVSVAAVVKRWGPGALIRVRQWTQANRLDVVNLQYQTAAFAMSPWIHWLPNAIGQVPVVTTFHDLRFPYLFPKAGPLRTWIVRRLARASDGVIVTNQEDALALADLPCIAVIPIGSNVTAAPDPDRERPPALAGIAPDSFMIGFFGFANRSKGLPVLLESLAALRHDGLPVHLLLIGGRTGSSDPTNAAYADEVDTAIQALGLSPYVTRTGYVDDVDIAGFLATCDVIALPFLDGASYRRGTLMAAIHHGCAIVTTQPVVDTPAFTDGANMLLVPPDDAPALATALRRLYNTPDLRDRLREGARTLRPLFDWAHIARETVAFYERVLAR